MNRNKTVCGFMCRNLVCSTRVHLVYLHCK